jgi:hypothetical protein
MIIDNKNIGFDELSVQILGGVNKALRKLVETSALHDESLVVGDKNGGFKSVPAKELLKEMNSKTAV